MDSLRGQLDKANARLDDLQAQVKSMLANVNSTSMTLGVEQECN